VQDHADYRADEIDLGRCFVLPQAKLATNGPASGSAKWSDSMPSGN
jgi:hypothetical protein